MWIFSNFNSISPYHMVIGVYYFGNFNFHNHFTGLNAFSRAWSTWWQCLWSLILFVPLNIKINLNCWNKKYSHLKINEPDWFGAGGGFVSNGGCTSPFSLQQNTGVLLLNPHRLNSWILILLAWMFSITQAHFLNFLKI